MRVKLIQPLAATRPMDTSLKARMAPHLGLLTIARIVEDCGHEVVVVNESIALNAAHVVMRPKNMTPEELYEGYLRVYREVYSLGNIWRRLPRARRQLMPYLLFNLLYRKWGAATERLGQLVGFDRIGALARRAAYFIR